MRQKRDGWKFAVDCGGNGGDDCSIGRKSNFCGAELGQFVDQHALEIELNRGARIAGRRFVRLGIDSHIAQEAIFQVCEEPVGHRSVPPLSTCARGAAVACAGSGSDENKSRPRRWARNRATSCPRTLFPVASNGGANVAKPPLPGETVTIPPPTPLFPGRPTS